MNPPAVLFEKVFSACECAELRDYALQQPAFTAQIGYGGGQAVHDMRRSTVRWLNASAMEMMAVKARLDRVMLKANAQHWGLDHRGFGDLQFTTYSSANAGHYDFHRDDNPAPAEGAPVLDRVLSVVVQLSPMDEHRGGRLEFEGREFSGFKQQGDVIVFPSCHRHRVTPVEEGCRYSLVAWSLGPRGQFDSPVQKISTPSKRKR